jgi:hypothetical protein
MNSEGYKVLHNMDTEQMKLELREFETSEGFDYAFVNVTEPDSKYQATKTEYKATLMDNHFLLSDSRGRPLNITDTKEELESRVLEKTDEEVLKIRAWEERGGRPPHTFLYATLLKRSNELKSGLGQD